MTSATAPNATPVLVWDKTNPQLKSPGKKNNLFMTIAMIAIVALCISGLWRTFHTAAPTKYVQVMAAGRDIPAGVRVGFTMVHFLEVPKRYVTKDMITSLNDVSDRVSKTFIPIGEPIKTTMLLPGHDGLSLDFSIDERAITLQLDDDALVDHAIQPEDRVDIMVVTNKESKKFTKTICQNARVLMAVPKEQVLAKHTSSNSNNKITLAVTPEKAEAIAEAVELGKIRLVLRNRLSRSEQQLAGAQPEDLLPDSAKNLTPASPQIVKTSVAGTLLPPPPVMPAIDLPALPAAAPSPVQWLVEAFSGTHKETYGVPEK
jgi:Flp pilus assembly protein CpaB